MKQHITIEQFYELTGVQQNKLRDWWEPRQGDIYLDKRHSITNVMNPHPEFRKTMLSTEVYPLLSIGQMAEFLGEDWYRLLFREGYTIGVDADYEGELCDALWCEVKVVLDEQTDPLREAIRQTIEDYLTSIYGEKGKP